MMKILLEISPYWLLVENAGFESIKNFILWGLETLYLSYYIQ